MANIKERLFTRRETVILSLTTGLLAAMREIPVLAEQPVNFKEVAPKTDVQKLEEYLKRIRLTRDNLREIVAENDFFEGFKDLTDEQRLEDFDMYFPMYQAAAETYRLPWYLIWIIHTQETVNSRHKKPESEKYTGAGQRNRFFYNQEVVEEASRGWEFLDILSQRYHPRNGFPTKDWAEILFIGWKIRYDADYQKRKDSRLEKEESLQEALYWYCPSDWENRWENYQNVKEIFSHLRPAYRGQRPVAR